jgi:glyoxylase I family protein
MHDLINIHSEIRLNIFMKNPIQQTGIDHPAIAVEKVDEIAEWYCKVLGYEKWFRHDKPVWMLKAADGSLLEIMPRDHTTRPERTTWTPGWSHLAIRVENIETALAHLEGQGVVWEGEMIEAIGGGKLRSFYDPEGNMLQVVQRG